MATPGDCPRSELQVISVLLCENLYLKARTITESGAQPRVMAFSLDLGGWPVTRGRFNRGNAQCVKVTHDVLKWAL